MRVVLAAVGRDRGILVEVLDEFSSDLKAWVGASPVSSQCLSVVQELMEALMAAFPVSPASGQRMLSSLLLRCCSI